MIIWIDGTYGVGKSTICQKLKEILIKSNYEILSSDYYFIEMLKKNPFIGGGTYPQNNIRFIELFKNLIEEKQNFNLIIDMALTQKECKEMLYDYLIEKGITIKHFILTANDETIKNRILKSNRKDKESAIFYLELNKNFLNSNFKNAIQIDTENKNVNKIVEEIVNLL